MRARQALPILKVFQDADDYESLTWCVEADDIRLYATCNDWFSWATAESQEILAGDAALLRSCLEDLKAVDAVVLLSELFACRKRKMRPMEAATRDMLPEVRALFDAAGTKEDRDRQDREDDAFWQRVADHIRKKKGKS